MQSELIFTSIRISAPIIVCYIHINPAVNTRPPPRCKIDVNVTDNNGSTDTNRSGNKFRLHNWLTSSSATATAYNNSRKLVRNADGNIYLVYYGDPPNGTNDEVWFA